uniref:RloB domain-containing protein n=1 Tax=Parabacteroides sp. D26 TaxID=658662 RepID=UPI00356AC042
MGRTVTKSIAIIGEGETEWFYFDSLRIACRYPFKVAPDFPQHSDINHILKLVESYLNKQYDYIVCLFDMDKLYQYPSEMLTMPKFTSQILLLFSKVLHILENLLL